MATKLDIEFYQDGRDALLNLDSTIIGNAAGAQRKRRPNDSSCTDFRHGPLQKNRDQEIAPSAPGKARDWLGGSPDMGESVAH